MCFNALVLTFTLACFSVAGFACASCCCCCGRTLSSLLSYVEHFFARPCPSTVCAPVHLLQYATEKCRQIYKRHCSTAATHLIKFSLRMLQQFLRLTYMATLNVVYDTFIPYFNVMRGVAYPLFNIIAPNSGLLLT